MANGQLTTVLGHIRKMIGLRSAADLVDAELLARFVDRQDGVAFDQLVERYGPMVLGVCRRVLRDAHEAEDAFQATFLVLVRKAAALRRGPLGGWLYGVAYRIAVRARADAARRQAREREAIEMKQDAVTTDASPHELRDVLDEELQRLPAKYRAPLVLCYLLGKSNEEAARELGCPLGSMWWRLNRAQELLRERLTRRGVTMPAALMGTVLTETAASAAVPTALRTTTVQAGLAWLAGPAAAGVAWARATTLAEGLLRSMFWGKVRMIGGLVLSLSFLGVAVGLIFPHAAAEPPSVAQVQPASADDPRPRLDRHGDPLPAQAVARLGTVRWRQQNIVSLAFTPDGLGLVASGIGENNVWLWDVKSGKEVRRFRSDSAAMRSGFALAPDGQTLVAGGKFNSIRFWDLKKAEQVREVEGVGVPRMYSPDGKLIAATYGHAIQLLDPATGKEIRKFNTAARTILWTLAFAPDSRTIASGHQDGLIRLWDVATGQELRQFQGHGKSVASLAFSPDGAMLASGGGDLSVRLWQVATGKEVRRLEEAPAKIEGPWMGPCVAWAPDGKVVASVRSDHPVHLWDPVTGKELRALAAPPGGVMALSFSGNSKLLGSANVNGTISLWDAATGKEAYPFDGHHGFVFSVAVAPDGRHVATAGDDDRVRLWNGATGQEVRQFHQPRCQLGKHLAFSADGKVLAGLCSEPRVGGYAPYGANAQILLWDMATGQELARVKGHSFVFTPDGKQLAISDWSPECGGQGGTIRVWDLATGKDLRELVKYEGKVSPEAFSPDGRTLTLRHVPSSGERKGARNAELIEEHLRRVDWLTGVEQSSIAVPVKGGRLSVLSPDGSLFAPRPFSASAPIPIELLATATGKEVRRFVGQKTYAEKLAISPDGRVLTSAGPGDRLIRVWEVATGKERCQLSGHTNAPLALVVSADGKSLISASADGTALVWELFGALDLTRPNAGKLSEEELETGWKDLASADAAAAYRAIRLLLSAPQQTVPLLADRVKPLSPDARLLARLVGDLDGPGFATRQKATAELEKLGAVATLAVQEYLKKALEDKPSLEQHRRLSDILKRLDADRVVLAPERMRTARVLEILEHIGTTGARQVLETLARGGADAWPTQEAKASLARLARRNDSR